jgi:hypothetical protein
VTGADEVVKSLQREFDKIYKRKVNVMNPEN